MSNNTTAPKGKKEQMRTMFNRIAPTYDKLNHIMSMNIDRRWRKRAMALVAACSPREVLDLATGTADLAIDMAEAMSEVRITGVDLSTEMLAVGREKVARAGFSERVTLLEGDAEQLPFADETFDAVTVAFGVRNFADLPLCLQEMRRVLRPGGCVVILELSTPQNPVVRFCYECYAFRFLPWIGGLVSKEQGAYRYLPASIRAFHKPTTVVEMMQQAGFTACRAERKTCGIAHIYYAVK